MSEKCKICGGKIFDENGQSWGTWHDGYGWVCDNPECEDLYSIKSKNIAYDSLRLRLCEITCLDYAQATDEEILEAVEGLKYISEASDE